MNIIDTSPKVRVYGKGPKECKIAIVGEALGAQEEKLGEPFVGRAGQLLNNILRITGIVRSECFITNVVKEKPPRNDIRTFVDISRKNVKETEMYKYYLDILKEELDDCTANVIVATGGVPLYALTGLKQITKRRGSIYKSTLLKGDRKVLPTIHPSSALRNYMYTHFISHDFFRAKEESEYPDIILPTRVLILEPTFIDIMEFMAACSSHDYVAFDIEVSNEEMSCISFAYDSRSAISIPFTHNGRPYFPPDQEVQIMKTIAYILENRNITKVVQNAVFDTTFLLRRYGIKTGPVEDTMIAQAVLVPDFPKGLDFMTSMYTKEQYYKDEGKKRIKGIASSDREFWKYNAKDSVVLMDILPALHAELNQLGNMNTYKHQLQLVDPLVYMSERGIRVDVEGLRKKSEEVGMELDKLKEEVIELSEGMIVNPNSTQQMMNYFYVSKGLKPYVNRTTGKPTLDKTALKRIARKGFDEAKLLLGIRRLSKLKGTYLDVVLDKDGRLRCSMNPVGAADSGRFSSSKTIFGTGCVLPTSEVLTPTGWVMFKDLKEGEEVMQWGSKGKLSWCVPKIHKFKHSGSMVVANSTFHKCVYTPDHRIPTIPKVGSYVLDKPAISVTERKSFWYLPIAGSFSSTTNIPCARVIPMIQADGSIEGNSVRFSFKKESKIRRFLWLADIYNIPFTEQNDKRPGYRRFCIRSSFAQPYIKLLQMFGKKSFGPWLLWCDSDTLDDILDEIKYWDSTIRGRSFVYYTTDPKNAEWVSTLAHIRGKSASVRCDYDNNAGYGKGNNKPLYIVNIKPRNHIIQNRDMYGTSNYNGDVYCVETDTTYFLLRHKGTIVVTGNTNMQNLDPIMKQFLLADDGYVMYNIDLGQADNRCVAYIAPEPSMIQAFESGADVHRMTASLIFRKPIKDITTKDNTCPIGDGKHSERFWGKKANHAFNYGQGYKRFALDNEIPESEAKFIRSAYHTAYPGVQQYWKWVEEKLRQNRMLVNPYGRKRKFMDRWGYELFKEAYSWIPQSTVADKINRDGVLFIYNNQQWFAPVEILNQIHDSIVFQIPLSIGWKQHGDILMRIKKSLESSITWRIRSFSIPVDLEMGTNLKDVHKVNMNTNNLHKELERVYNERIKAGDE